MPTISTCPYCREQLAVPPGAAADADVRCPLCQAEFALQDVLDIALPELIVVTTPRSELVAAAVGAALATAASDSVFDDSHENTAAAQAASNGAANDPDLSAAEDAAVSEGMPDPHHDVAATADDKIDLSLGEPAKPAADGAKPSEEDAGKSSIDDIAIAALSAAPPADPSAESVIRKLGQAPSDEFHAGQFDFGQERPAAAGFDAEVAAAIESRPRPKKKAPNMALELVKVIVGGFVGLLVAYQILLCAGRDPLQIAKSWPIQFLVNKSLRE
jgi:LSD1 subclass zinc finger protein